MDFQLKFYRIFDASGPVTASLWRKFLSRSLNSSSRCRYTLRMSSGFTCRVHSPVIWLVVFCPTPLKHMSSSTGMMIFPIYGKIKHVPNHQPVMYTSLDSTFQPLQIILGKFHHDLTTTEPWESLIA